MRYKVGDRVKVKSLNWYNENKDEYGNVEGLGKDSFVEKMSKYCGLMAVIKNIDDVESEYKLDIDNGYWGWTDDMFEGLVEEKKPCDYISFNAKNLSFADKVEIQLGDDWEIKEENGKWFAVKKKKEYPKTYEECCKVLNTTPQERCQFDFEPYGEELYNLHRLLICRDTYWKIAGEEMGLGKAWEPDWKDGEQKKYCIFNDSDEIKKGDWCFCHTVIAFPTEKIRDAFFENFKELIEQCKKLL